MRTLMMLAGVSLLAMNAAQADDGGTKPGWLGWNGDVELGYNAASGNSNTSSLKADANARRDWRKWAVEADAKARFASSDHVRSEENYFAGLQGERKLGDKDFVFAAADYTVDNFSGYDYQTTQTVGYGRELFKTGSQTLKGQLGVGLRESADETDSTQTEAVLKPELNYAWQINDKIAFTEEAKGTIGTEYSVLESETGVKSDLTDTLYLKASYTVKHTTEVPAGRKKNDTYTGISIGYAF